MWLQFLEDHLSCRTHLNRPTGHRTVSPQSAVVYLGCWGDRALNVTKRSIRIPSDSMSLLIMAGYSEIFCLYHSSLGGWSEIF